jgi:hypothetical protein
MMHIYAQLFLSEPLAKTLMLARAECRGRNLELVQLFSVGFWQHAKLPACEESDLQTHCWIHFT